MAVTGERVFIIDTCYCFHKAQKYMRRNLNAVYTRVNFVDQAGAGKKSRK